MPEISWQRMLHSLLVLFFFQECQVFSSLPSITFPLLMHPEKQLGNLSFHFFTGSTHKFRKAVIQVFSTPVSSSTDLQHTMSLNCFDPDLTPMAYQGNCIAKLPPWRQSPARACAQGEKCTSLQPCSSSREQWDASELPLPGGTAWEDH